MTVEHRRYLGQREQCEVCNPPRLKGGAQQTNPQFVWKVGPSCTHYECEDCGSPYGGVETPCDRPTDDLAVLRARQIEAARVRRTNGTGRAPHQEV